MKSLVSVIVPIYKVEKYLNKCVDSIINQSYKNLEIILVDDGSPDKCGEICDKYVEKDSRVKVIHKQNGGLSDARNAGIDIAKGDYLLFVDSDDWINKYMIENLVLFATDKNLDIVECKFISVHDRREIKDEVNVGECKIFSNIEALENHFNGEGVYRCVWNKLYRKYLFDDLRFPKGKVAEDLHTTYKLLFKANKVGLIDFVGYYYYIRENSIMGKGGLKLIISTYEGIKDQNEFITENVNILKLKINDIYFKTLIKTFSYLENYKGTENIENYKIEVSNELKREDIEIKGKLNILKLGFNIMPQLTSKVVQRLVNEKER